MIIVALPEKKVDPLDIEKDKDSPNKPKRVDSSDTDDTDDTDDTSSEEEKEAKSASTNCDSCGSVLTADQVKSRRMLNTMDKRNQKDLSSSSSTPGNHIICYFIKNSM
ncbi:hypothetical protein TNIN_84231 [Trichonephila inaurata madagascariensis]|uniref:Uncharacterized protein n=1 Tax=Trichonephila inaurata madagascariensis TaxID=2747483 RepID=A0A8X6XFQ8_9ARAC|nr:hypothetical protein TNIN_84231 [Trichonephila inaurata madagascariensis]